MLMVCYGDSNTFGFDPRSWLGDWYAPEDRWVDILAQLSGWDIRNNGMNGRRIPGREVVFSKSTDKILIMLGTNDILQGDTAQQACQRMEAFLQTLDTVREKLILLAPPPLRRGEWVTDFQILQSLEYCTQLDTLARRLRIPFVNTAQWDIPMCFDGVHFTAEGHSRFASNLYDILQKL